MTEQTKTPTHGRQAPPTVQMWDVLAEHLDEADFLGRTGSST
ncbi:MAG: hypothetical protein WCC48_10720 [Anaeromyxobacteraceae bacterium]